MRLRILKMQVLPIVAVLGLMANFCSAQVAAKRVDPSGTWRFEYDLEGLTVKDSLELQLGKDGMLTGLYRGRSEEPVETSSGKIDGDKVIVEMSIDYLGMPVTVKFDGTIKEDDIDGVVIASTPEGEIEFDWIAKRSVEPEDVVGMWDLEIDAVETVLEPTVEIKLEGKELKGQYKDPDTGLEVDLQDLKIENNTLKFSIEGDFNGNSLKADFKGRPYGSKISGTIDYDLSGQTGEVEFEGVRKAPKKEEPKEEPKDAIKREPTAQPGARATTDIAP